jgi:hypothetical protein
MFITAKNGIVLVLDPEFGELIFVEIKTPLQREKAGHVSPKETLFILFIGASVL